MTLITALNFRNSGALVADERITDSEEKGANIENKVKILNERVLVGGSGSYRAIKEFMKNVENIAHIETPWQVYMTSREEVARGVYDVKNRFLKEKFGIGYDEFIRNGLGERFSSEIRKEIYGEFKNIEEELDAFILVAGMNGKNFEMYRFGQYVLDEVNFSSKFLSIGSGSEDADRILIDYFETLPRNKRLYPEKIPGLIKLIEAMNYSSKRDLGVGGIPNIFYIDSSGIKNPPENSAKLASEIVRACNAGFLSRDFMYSSIDELILKGAHYEGVEERMRTEAKNWKKLDRFLRGYRVHYS